MRHARPLPFFRQSASGVIARGRQASHGTARHACIVLLAGAALCGGATITTAARADIAPADASAAPPYTVTANIALASQYRYRGLMQTDNKPAIQGGFDFTHQSGFYLGNWNSNISWLSDSNPAVSAPVEMDFYGGYRGNAARDVPFDLGALKYYYPGDYPSGFTNPDTTEFYGSIGYKTTTFKYSYAVSNLFGFAKSKGSQYFDLSGNYDLGTWGLTLNTHVGYQYVRNVDNASYYDWKLGLTKDMGQGLAVSLAYIDTNADRDVYTNSQGRFMGRGTVLVSLAKTF
ncbi:TorF family putative porin [Bordetella genomosp. 11]|uniref:Uncharacterized protein n=1 Tax=Bordetella genomosp. 11 TaxID=1416808 RepID=A0A261UM50_9BORD|nr:TorF family putative porin [Bordetella genomosp. 11]OZI61983.1 hypothetical protein CAL28_22385 [Bordetella genomosp. 11]